MSVINRTPLQPVPESVATGHVGGKVSEICLIEKTKLKLNWAGSDHVEIDCELVSSTQPLDL